MIAPYIVKKEFLLRSYLAAFNPPSDPVCAFGLGALESTRVSAGDTLANRGLRETSQPGSRSANRPARCFVW